MSYVLGVKELQTHAKADMGSAVHKALELLAWQKKGEQDNIDKYFDKELGIEYILRDIEPIKVLNDAFEHYKNRSELTWKDSYYDDCKKWLLDTLEFNNGMFDPRKRFVVSPEVYFDFQINEPWARYDYTDPFTGESLSGTLAIKGTIDLVTKLNENTFEYLDWKTGRRWSWADDVVKTPEKLYDDFQLLLYYYALRRLYPNIENIYVTIFFCRDGGPFSMCFEDIHEKRFLQKLRNIFQEIQSQQKPERIITDPDKNGKCFSFCGYHRAKMEDGKTSVCKHFHQELVQLGMEATVKKHGDINKIVRYGDGGGLSNREI